MKKKIYFILFVLCFGVTIFVVFLLDKNKKTKLLFKKAELYYKLGYYDKSDSLYKIILDQYIRKIHNDSLYYLAKFYYNYSKFYLEKNSIFSAESLAYKAVFFSKKSNDSLTLALTYKILSDISYYKGTMKKCVMYFDSSFSILKNKNDYTRLINFLDDITIYYQSKNFKLYRFSKYFDYIFSHRYNLTIDQSIKFYIIYTKYVDDTQSDKYKILKLYFRLIDLSKKYPNNFKKYASEFFEVFFPILNRYGYIELADSLVNQIILRFNLERDSLLTNQTVQMAFWLYNTGNYSKAQKLFKKALKEYLNKYGKNSPVVADLMEKIGIMYLSSGLGLEARNFFLRSLEIKKTYNKGNIFEYGVLFTNLGESFRLNSEYDSSLKYYRRAIKNFRLLQKDTLKVDSLNIYIAKVYHNLGVLFMDIKDYDSSLFYLKLSYKIKKKFFKNERNIEFFYTDIALGRVYQILGVFDSSFFYYKKAKKIIDYYGLNGTIYSVSYWIGMGILYYHYGELEKARQYLEKSEIFLEKSESFQSERLREVRKILFNIAKKQNDIETIERLRKKLYEW